MEQHCPSCGADLPPEERPSACPVCGADLQPEEGEEIPFDNPGRLGFFRSLWQTWREATFTPNAFFPRIPTSAAVTWPLLYAVLFGWLQALANVLIQQPMLRASRATLPPQLRNMAEAFQTTPEAVAMQFILEPFITVVVILLSSAVFHAILYLLNGARPEFVITVRTVSYTAGAYAAYFIPVLGPLLYVIGVLTLLIIGLARAHQTEGWRSALAVLLPAVACCGAMGMLMLFTAAFLLRATNVM